MEVWAIFDQIPIQNHSRDTGGCIETSSMFHIDAIKVITFHFPILLMYSIAIYEAVHCLQRNMVSLVDVSFSFTKVLVHYAIFVKVLNWL